MHDYESLPMISIARAQGSWLHAHDGKRYLDLVSSWWTCLFGHNHAPIVSALKTQLNQLDHVLLAGFTHEPAIELAEQLIASTPGLSRVFYCDNGSSATDTALKMALHYWRNQGQDSKRRFVCLRNSYHGETIGALSVTDIDLYREHYRALMFDAIMVMPPDRYQQPRELDESAWIEQCLSELRAVFEQHHSELAGIILEPLVQCAGGMRMYDGAYLRGVRKLCDEYGVLMMADEIAVGMARTGVNRGSIWATIGANALPDLLLIGKALSGGFLTLAAVLVREQIYQAFYAEYETRRAFLHSHSYCGNPLACRAATVAMKLLHAPGFALEHDKRSAMLTERLEPLRALPHVADVRVQGFIGAVELALDPVQKIPFDWRERRGLRVYRHALERGVLMRPLGNVIYFLPPYCITEEELDLAVSVAKTGILSAVASI
jgi:adenosylmethionine-8-amino-7-oxononanoate aminotransferase